MGAGENKDTGSGKLLTTSEAARHLGVTKRAISRLREEGKLPGVKGRWGRWYYAPESLAAVITDAPPAAQESSPTADPDTPPPQDASAQKPQWGQSLASIMLEITPPQRDDDAEDCNATDQAPIVRMANAILVLAIDARASDVHIEPDSRYMRVRCRIDGLLQEIMRVPNHIKGPLIQRYKVMADMNVLERRLPQAGWVPLKHAGNDYNMRVSTVRSLYGEDVILHILKRQDCSQGLERLGMDIDEQGSVERLLFNRPSGLVLVAGPGGSGITTTAYNLLFKLLSIETKIVTLEAFPEYDLSGAVQSCYGGKFRSSLAASLRMLPLMNADVLFLGDIKTAEAASGALEAALSGKRVIATLAAGDTETSLWRMKQMGITQDQLDQVLLGVIAQRLVRRICENCTEQYTITPSEWDSFGFSSRRERSQLSRGTGCEMCKGYGYKGLTGLFETFEADTGYKPTSLHIAAEELVLAGTTTPNEIFRVLGVLKNSDV